MNITYVINTPAFFLSHRKAIAQQALASGHAVNVLTGKEFQHSTVTEIQKMDIAHHAANFTATGRNPLFELIGLFSVLRKMAGLKPDIVHTVSPKGNLYGGIAARLCQVPKLVVAVSGQGFLFTGQRSGWKAVLAGIYLQLIRWVYAHPNCTVIVQNRDDWDALLNQGLVRREQLVLIPGSGVDLSRYEATARSVPDSIVLLPARLLTDKGVVEFVQAARQLRWPGSSWRFVLAGEADGSNPSAITSVQVEQWVDEGIVEWWGHCSDMPSVFAQAAIVCLPSYREGMPKALLEAAVCGRPVVTTDTVGCREAIIDGETGILVPVRDADALAQALLRLIDDPTLRERMGKAGRERAIREFDIRAVVAKHLVIYAS